MEVLLSIPDSLRPYFEFIPKDVLSGILVALIEEGLHERLNSKPEAFDEKKLEELMSAVIERAIGNKVTVIEAHDKDLESKAPPRLVETVVTLPQQFTAAEEEEFGALLDLMK